MNKGTFDNLNSSPGAIGPDMPLPEAVLEQVLATDAPPAARSQGRRARPLPNTDEIDTFATPSQPPADDTPLPLIGFEPAVFGGVNPGQHAPLSDAPAVPVDYAAQAVEATAAGVEQTLEELLEVEDPLTAEDILGEAPRLDLAKTIKSTPFLVVLMLVCLAGATMLIQKAIKTVTFVEMNIEFVNYSKLDEDQRRELQAGINQMLRSYPLRADAWDVLQKKDPKLSPGFLNSGLTFHRFDSLLWEKNGRINLRVDTDDPATDLLRLSSAAEAFYNMAQTRNTTLEQNKASLKTSEASQLQLLQRDAILKQQTDDLLPEAQHYIDLKAALQGTQRYLDLAEESNPLRVVARENLRTLTGEVAAARRASERRDDLVITRVQVQREISDLRQLIATLRRDIDCFSYPLPPDPKTIAIVDTRDRRQNVLRGAWAGIILCFAGIFAGLRYGQSRSADLQRRERRTRRNTRETVGRTGKSKSAHTDLESS